MTMMETTGQTGQPDPRTEAANLAADLLSNIPYCPWAPNEGPQSMFLLDFGREALYGGAAGGGKALRLTELLPTPTGFRKLGDLHPGDLLLGRDGNPITVLAESETWTLPGWKFTFDDGSEVVSNDEHLWLTFDAKELANLTRRDPEWRARRRAGRASRGTGKRPDLAIRNTATAEGGPLPVGTVRTTADIVSSLRTSTGRANHAVPVCEPVDLPEADLPLDPYVFGLWLGDGTSCSGQFTSADLALAEAYTAAGFQAHPLKSLYRYGTYGLAPVLRRMGVLGQKHVPGSYLWASKEQRLALLQGLMDTDGNVSQSSGAEFTNTNRDLAEAVAHLARSLGHKVAVRQGEAKLNERVIGPKWVVKFQPHVQVFRLTRKAERVRIATRRTTKFRYIVSVERTDPEPMKCLKVSAPDSLFLVTEHFIPTHNSIALMMAASMFLHVPGYAALLLRKSYSELTKPGALMDIAESWWRSTPGARFDTKENTWYFDCPGGGTSRIVFGYLDKIGDKEKYQGGAYQFVGFDELTHFRESDYRYLFSRMRKVDNPDNPLSRVPIRMRATANPGGAGHQWVFKRFIGPFVAWKEKGSIRPRRNFYPALLSDNPTLNQADYIESLMELDPVTRAQLLRGDWNIRPEGRMFKADWFQKITIDAVPASVSWVRFWDMASTEEDPEKDQKRGGPDFTAGALIGRDPVTGNHYVADIRHWRQEAGMNDLLLGAVAVHDTTRVPQIMEQEPGASGKIAIHHYRNGAFAGMNFRGIPATGSKVVRASPVASLAQQGKVFVVTDGTWDVDGFLDEVEMFPDPAVHDDRVDAVSGAFSVLAKHFRGIINLGEHMNTDFTRSNPWRPDVTLVLSPADLAAGSGTLNEKVAAARMTEIQLREAVSRAWAV